MKKISKFLAIILSVIMFISLVPISSSAAIYSGTCGANLTWTYDSSTYTLTISGTGEMYDYEPNNRPWESYEDNIKTVVINNGVTAIGDRAFYECEDLKSVTIPDSVTSIGNYAFCDCTSLTSATIPDSVTTIGNSAFSSCYSLINVTFPDSVTTIGNWAFSRCHRLPSITIPDSVTTIGSHLFWYCSSLTDVYYNGTQEQWNKISIGYNNKDLLNANIHFKECKHKFSDWAIETSPNCTDTGLEKRACTECGKEEIRNIPALGHKYNSVVTNPTCTERGYTTYTCHCGYSYVGNYANAKGHNYVEIVTPPTCTQNGYTTYTCECGDTYMKNMIPTTGHEDLNIDAYCDHCDELLCDHDCHRGGITGFFWKITNFFNRLFGSNKQCECGVAHY